MSRFILVLALVMLLFSCDGPVAENSPIDVVSDSLITINIDSPGNTIDLKLSDLVDSVELLQIETTPEALIGNGSIYVGDYYIIYSGQNGLFRFSQNGEFERVIANIGRGPEEISMFTQLYFDNKRGLLFIDDMQRDRSFLLYDLKADKFLDPVKKCAQLFWYSFHLVNDSVIAGTAYMDPQEAGIRCAIFFQNMEGDFLYGIPNNRKYGDGPEQDERIPYCRFNVLNGEMFARFDNNDTIFKVIDNVFDPYLVMAFDGPRDKPPVGYPNEGDKNMGVPPRVTVSFVLFTERKIENIQVIGENMRVSNSYSHVIFDRFSGKASKIGSYTDDFIGKTQESLDDMIRFPGFLPNGKLVVEYSPTDIIEAVKNGLNYEDYPESINNQLIEISKNLQETDNPVLLVGKIKERL